MLPKCHLAILLFAVSVLTPLLVWTQTTDTAKVLPPDTALLKTPDPRPADSVTALALPDTDTIFGPNDWMVIESHHRMYPAFLQIDTVKPNQPFQLGEDGPFAEVVKFVADLKVSMKGERTKMSDTLYNPAVLVRVFVPDSITQQDSVTQESWAFFYGSQPHFTRQSFFAFLLLDFKVENPKYVKPPKDQ